MTLRTIAAAAVLALAAPAVPALAAAPAAAVSPAMQGVLDYARGQGTTGFLVIQDGKVLVERNWPLPADAAKFKADMTYGVAGDGALMEDVASQQKSFVAVLAAIAVDKGLLDVERPVSAYLGAGWSKAPPEAEAKIRVLDVLTMSSGLRPNFTYAAPASTTFLYNTPVYAITKKVLAAAAKAPLETITHDWLTAPLGMADTAWRQRPAAFADVGNPTGLVTTPRDTAKFGQMVLDGGKAANGKRVVSQAQLSALLMRSATNPAYGRLWWLNGSAYVMRPAGVRVEHALIPTAPADTVAALGASDRKLYVTPSRKLIVVRMGQAAPDRDFDETLWAKLTPALAR